MSYKQLSFIFLFLLICALSATAIDCTKLNDYENCIYLENSGIEDKDMLQANLIYNSSYFPDHNSIYEWNDEIEVTSAPEGVILKSSGYIKNAWIEIFTAMPSVIYNNLVYVPQNIDMFSGYGYTINLPSQTSGETGECKRTYHLLSTSEDFRLYRNNEVIGNSKKLAVSINENSSFNAKLKVTLNYRIKHYKMKYVCTDWCVTSCCSYEWLCEYDHSSDHTNSLDVDDYYNVSYYEDTANVDFNVIQTYSGTTKAKVSSNHSYELMLEDGFYKDYAYFYNVNYSYKPYYFLYLQAKDINQSSAKNILADNYLYFNSNECTVNYWDWFNSYEKECNLSYQDSNLSIILPKYKYKIGEEITLELYPENTLVNVSYAEESKLAENKVIFLARDGFNTITAQLNEVKTEKFIHLKQTKWWLISVLATLTGFVYIIYLILKKYYGDYVD